MSRDNETKIDLKNLKAGGFIKERAKDLFTVRLRVPGGRMPVERLKKIAEVADKYGGECVHLSVRQSIELIHVNFKHFDAVVAELAEAGQQVASCGPRLRVPVACGGCEYNPNGLMDTQQAALEVDRELFGSMTGHHKFKVGFSGCPHDCPKAAINDVGFVAAALPGWDENNCLACGLCATSCREGAIVQGKDEKPVFLPENCLYCGDCVKVCPSESWEVLKRGYSVYAGGKWGRQPMVGTLIATFFPADQVVPVIREILEWYKDQAEALGRIRLGEVLLRKGVASLLDRLRSRFPNHVKLETAPPTVIDRQIKGECGEG
jgi:anaerobic sulfite reductase subunit C